MSVDFSLGIVIFYRSENGRDNWQRVKPEDVPQEFKHPDRLGRMLSGFDAMDAKGDQCWYMALKAEDVRRMGEP